MFYKIGGLDKDNVLPGKNCLKEKSIEDEKLF
jgi:hypothetical protein